MCTAIERLLREPSVHGRHGRHDFYRYNNNCSGDCAVPAIRCTLRYMYTGDSDRYTTIRPIVVHVRLDRTHIDTRSTKHVSVGSTPRRTRAREKQ